MASIQPLLAGYPTGAPTSNADLDLAQRTGSSSIDEYFGSFRLDHRINDKLTQYLRYNRDQGYLTQPLDVTGSDQIVTGVPQNVVYTLQQILTPTRGQRNQVGLQRQQDAHQWLCTADPGSGYQRVCGQLHGNRGDSGHRRPRRFGGSLVAGQSDPRQQLPEWPRPALYELHYVVHRQSQRDHRRAHALKFGFEFRPVRLYTDRQGGTTYTFPNIDRAAGEHADLHPGSGRYQRARPVEQRRHRQPVPEAVLPDLLRAGRVEDPAQPDHELRSALRVLSARCTEDRNLFVLFNADTGKIACGTTPDATCRIPRPGITSSKTELWAAAGDFAGHRRSFNNKTVFRIGAGYYYGPGQTEDQVQTIDSDRASRTLTSNIAWPIIRRRCWRGLQHQYPNLGYQPRAYGNGTRCRKRCSPIRHRSNRSCRATQC